MEGYSPVKVAIVHDWLTGMRGGERCLEVICEMFPGADLYTLFYRPERISAQLRAHRPIVSWLGRLPFVAKYYRHLLPFYALGIKDLSKKLQSAHLSAGYDLVISISHCVAKNIRVPEGTPHLCYCLTPMRYIWDQYDAYFQGSRAEPLIRVVAKRLRSWDVERAKAVTRFVAISEFVRARIKRVYGCDASVVYPPVRTEWIRPSSALPEARYLCVNALVPYKNTHLIVEAFNQLGLPLTIVGQGPEEGRLRALAAKVSPSKINFIPHVTDHELAELYRSSKALVFAAEEDFGMTPVEMQAAGRPVIAFGRGGVLETVLGRGDKRSGVFFSELSSEAIVAAILSFQDGAAEFTVENCVNQARRFGVEHFRKLFADEVQQLLARPSAGKSKSGYSRPSPELLESRPNFIVE